MRQISGPVAAVIHNFAENHVGLRADVVIKDGVDLTVCGVAEFALCAGVCPGSILGSVQTGSEILLVLCALNKDLCILHCCDSDLLAAGDMKCPGAFCEDVFSGDSLLAFRPLKGDLTGKKQDCDFFAFSAELSCAACSHTIETDIHQHVAIFVVISGKNLLAILVECGISE